MYVANIPSATFSILYTPLTVSKLRAHHLRKQVPVVAVNLWREVVYTEHIVCTVGQDTGTIRGPSLERMTVY